MNAVDNEGDEDGGSDGGGGGVLLLFPLLKMDCGARITMWMCSLRSNSIWFICAAHFHFDDAWRWRIYIHSSLFLAATSRPMWCLFALPVHSTSKNSMKVQLITCTEYIYEYIFIYVKYTVAMATALPFDDESRFTLVHFEPVKY